LSSGTTTLVFPTDVDVHVEAETSSGDINASGMERDGDAYVNEPYEDSNVTLKHGNSCSAEAWVPAGCRWDTASANSRP
jgi:hypothetical protein